MTAWVTTDDLWVSRLDYLCSLITRNLSVKLTEFQRISFSWKVSLLPVNDGMRRIVCLWSMRTWCWHRSEGLWRCQQPGSARKCSIWKNHLVNFKQSLYSKTICRIEKNQPVTNSFAIWSKKPVFSLSTNAIHKKLKCLAKFCKMISSSFWKRLVFKKSWEVLFRSIDLSMGPLKKMQKSRNTVPWKKIIFFFHWYLAVRKGEG